MSHEFVAYIDESGDDGLKKFRGKNEDGSSQWLVLGCCIVRKNNDLSLVKQRDSILQEIGRTKDRRIHFHKYNHAQKIAICRSMAKLPIKLISILSAKSSLPQDHAFKKERHKLYWYLARHLIERLSWLCDDEGKEQKLVKIIFSNRSGLSYQDFQEYLQILKTQCETQIRWRTIDIGRVQSRPHHQLAGLQLADCSARAFAEAVEPTRYGDFETRYAETLKPITYCRRRKYLSYGVKILPNPDVLNKEQGRLLEIFKK